MAYRVSLAHRAQIDISIAESWLSQLGLTVLKRWGARLAKALQILEADAHRFPLAEEDVDLSYALRESTFGRKPHIYRILFTVTESDVFIYRIRHAARDQITETDL